MKEFTLHRVSPFLIVAITSTPSTVPEIFPLPPERLMPPRMTPARIDISLPAPEEGMAAPVCEESRKPPMPAQTALYIIAPNCTRAAEMPLR